MYWGFLVAALSVPACKPVVVPSHAAQERASAPGVMPIPVVAQAGQRSLPELLARQGRGTGIPLRICQGNVSGAVQAVPNLTIPAPAADDRPAYLAALRLAVTALPRTVTEAVGSSIHLFAGAGADGQCQQSPALGPGVCQGDAPATWHVSGPVTLNHFVLRAAGIQFGRMLLGSSAGDPASAQAALLNFARLYRQERDALLARRLIVGSPELVRDRPLLTEELTGEAMYMNFCSSQTRSVFRQNFPDTHRAFSAMIARTVTPAQQRAGNRQQEAGTGAGRVSLADAAILLDAFSMSPRTANRLRLEALQLLTASGVPEVFPPGFSAFFSLSGEASVLGPEQYMLP